MRAFVDTEVTKSRLIASLEAHAAADRIAKGHYWRGNGAGKGCAVGCTLHDFYPGRESRHDLYEVAFGVPVMLAHMEDRVFEGLPDDKVTAWPLRFTRAIREGADLSRVGPAVLCRIVDRRLAALGRLAVPDDDPAADQVTAAIEQVAAALRQTLSVLERWRDAGEIDAAAADSAKSAADSAWFAAASARSATTSAWFAADSARYAAASARSAADSARFAADSAGYAADSARFAAASAGYAEYEWIADVLIEEIERAPVEQAA